MADEDPKCTHCFQPITGDILNYGGKPYHVNHLLCSKCSTPLGAGVSIKNMGGKPYCASCWTAVMYGAAVPAKAAAPAPAPAAQAAAPPPAVKTVLSQPMLQVQTTVVTTPAPETVKTHTQVTDQIKQNPAALKHTEIAHDASAPKVEAVTIKPNPHPAVMNEVTKAPALKHTEVAHDASKPVIAPNTQVQKNERSTLFNEIKSREASINPAAVASGGSDVLKTLDDAIRGAETSLRMIDATKKTVASNEKNLEDSKNGVLACDPIPEAEKKLASSKDLLQAHTETAARKLKTAAYCYEQAKRVATDAAKERYNKLVANAKNYGL